MYIVDDQDKIVEISSIPAPNAGTPEPIVCSVSQNLLLSYFSAGDERERVVLNFADARAHYFGSPNDEALSSHPLYSSGLRYYGVYEVLSSSWIRMQEVANRIHPQHNPHSFETLRHFILTFHDETFECVARDIAVLARAPFSAEDNRSLLLQLADWLR